MKTLENAVAVRVRITKARASMKDEFLSDDICNKYGIDKSSARVQKDIFKLTDVNRPITAIRAYLREKGVPWSATSEDAHGKKKQDAVWVFNGREVKELTTFNRERKEEFEAAVKNMADNWDDVVADVRRRHGAAFRPEDLPTREEFLSQFAWTMEMEPLMDIADAEHDFRIRMPDDVPDEVIEEQVQRMRADLGTKVHNVFRDLMDRVASELLGDERDKGLIAGLEQYDPDPNDKRKGNTFRDSRLYGNMNGLRDFAESISEVFDHDGLHSLRDRLRTFCDDILPQDAELVRTDDAVRQRVIQGLKGLLDPHKMPEADDGGTPSPDATAPGSTGATKSGGFGQFV